MSLPEEFISYTRKMMGDALFSRLSEGLQSPSVTSVRINPEKKLEQGVSFSSDDTTRQVTAVPWCKDGYYLSSRPNFTFDPSLHAGAYYVQEAASMFVDHVVRQHIHHPVLMLDLCAAPGGKSTALRAALPEGSLLVCNEPIHQRANILMENMQKWGHPDVMVTQATPAEYRRSGLHFDAILADVPCSGEGMFRKDTKAIDEWSVQNVLRCQQLQREIVADAWSCLRPGGLFIYSTCTFNTKENEENIGWMMEEFGAEVLATETHEEWGITGSLLPTLQMPVYRFIPGVSRGEGLFMAVLRKKGDRQSILESHQATKGNKHKSKMRQPASPKDKKNISIEDWIEGHSTYAFYEQGEVVRAIHHWWKHIYDRMKGLRVLHAGIEVASLRGRDYLPCHALALSTVLRRSMFEEYAASYEEAIRYLRREAIALPSDLKRGFVIITYQGLPLGFVKHLGNRANNLYPQEWRIMSQLKNGGDK